MGGTGGGGEDSLGVGGGEPDRRVGFDDVRCWLFVVGVSGDEGGGGAMS